MRFTQALAAGLLSLIYPRVCVGCRRRTDNPAIPLCMSCVDRLEPAAEPALIEIVDRLPVETETLDRCCAVWMFERNSPLQKLLHKIKYENRPSIGMELGQLLGKTCADHWSAGIAAPPDVICPIPLHRTRYLERGYNQSGRLARGAGNVLQLDVSTGVLIRSRATRSQTNLSREDRWTNVRDAFTVVDRNAVAGRSILLIDDVLTTGSTLAAAALALRRSGASSVSTATVAVARRHKKL